MGAGAMALASAAPAFAAGPPTTYTPGSPNCHGQFIASSNNNGVPGVASHLSIGQAAKTFGVSVEFLQDYAAHKCSV